MCSADSASCGIGPPQGQLAFTDCAASAGYLLVVASAEVAAAMASRRLYWLAFAWGCVAYFIFLVKTLRRDLQRGAPGGSSKKACVAVVAAIAACISLSCLHSIDRGSSFM